MAIPQEWLLQAAERIKAGNSRYFTKDEVRKKAESFQGHRGLSDGDPSTTARMGQGLWDKAYEQVVEELMGMKAIDDKELLSYLLTHAQSFESYKPMYGGKLAQAVKDAREFLKKMPFRPEYATMTFKSKAVARLLETANDVMTLTDNVLLGLGCTEKRTAYSDFTIPYSQMRRFMAGLAEQGFQAQGGSLWVHKEWKTKIKATKQGGIINVRTIKPS